MKKSLLSLAMIFIANFAFGQLTLEHSFPSNQDVSIFNDGTTIYYFVSRFDTGDNEYRNKIHIYNSDYSLYRTITFPWDTSFDSGITFLGNYGISKKVFNTNDNFEFVVYTINNSTHESKAFIMDEDGIIIKDITNYYNSVEVFHDNQNNVNKIRLKKIDGSLAGMDEIYLLPTTVLTTVGLQKGSNMSAFPIPTNKTLNILNPNNGSNKVEVFDMNGKLILSKTFTPTENKVSLDVENIQNGIYIYKVGELSAKFIKN